MVIQRVNLTINLKPIHLTPTKSGNEIRSLRHLKSNLAKGFQAQDLLHLVSTAHIPQLMLSDMK